MFVVKTDHRLGLQPTAFLSPLLLFFLLSSCRLQAASWDGILCSNVTVTFQSHNHRTLQHHFFEHGILPWLSGSVLLWKQEQCHTGSGSLIHSYWWWWRDGRVSWHLWWGMGEFNSGGSLIEQKRVWALESEVLSLNTAPASFQLCQPGQVISFSNPQLLICQVRMIIAASLDFVKTR